MDWERHDQVLRKDEAGCELYTLMIIDCIRHCMINDGYCNSRAKGVHSPF